MVEPAEEITPDKAAYFFADYRDGALLALALANPSDQPLAVRVVSYRNVPGSSVLDTTVNIPANSARAFVLNELGTIPENHVGLARISAPRSVYTIGLKFTGQVFTTLPAMVR